MCWLSASHLHWDTHPTHHNGIPIMYDSTIPFQHSRVSQTCHWNSSPDSSHWAWTSSLWSVRTWTGVSFTADQIIIEWSEEQLAKVFPLILIATPVTRAWAESFLVIEALETSQTRTWQSFEPETRTLLSGERTIHKIFESWANLCFCVASFTFH